MGYSVYITRGRHHMDGPQVPIPQEDWHALIDNDPGLTATKSQPDLARWIGPCSIADPCVDWANGNLFSRDPDHSVVRKLVDIAGLLGGRVQGDGGELYLVERGQIVRQEPAPVSEAESDRTEPGGPTPFEGVEQVTPAGLEASMAEEELEAALGAVTTHTATVLENAGEGESDDPNASFARPPDDALEQNQGGAPETVPFTVGQRVRTSWGRPGTIVSIDPDADSGMGHIEIKYHDGRTATTSCVAHGLDLM